MCGIIGYIGDKKALPILIQGLRKLEYRGYDSAGIAVVNRPACSDCANIKIVRSIGKIENLSKKIAKKEIEGTCGIAHTRWATHGGVTENNSHPHTDNSKNITIVHNGIIENYREIKQKLGDTHTYESETDSEVLAHLIGHYVEKNTEKLTQETFRKSIEQALQEVRGTYGIVVMHKDIPNCLIAARMGSPLVIGVGEKEYYVASDATPILPYTKKVVFLDDGEIAEITKTNLQTFTLKDESITKHVEEIEWNAEEAEKQGYEHFMLKEIHDQTTVFEDAIRGRYNLEEGTAHLGGLNMTDDEMRSINRIILIACGTASYAGLVGKYAFERLTGIPTRVEVASEFRYSDPIVDEKTLVFGISQSGETADTLAALREAKRKGAFVRGIVNVVGSTIARETDGGTYIHAGPELAVASTKAYTNMIAILMLYALQFGRLKRITLATGQRFLQALIEIPEKMQTILDQKEKIKIIAEKYSQTKTLLFIGRGVNYPVALEGALKLKEISYIFAEAYPGGEMKHGPIALLSETCPVMAIMTRDQLYEKMQSNIEEVHARKAPLILIATEGDEQAKRFSEDIMYVPDTMELLEPLLNTIPLQLFAYYVSAHLGRDVDRPRNLAKSVTVE
jgi:glutamine---fructose-6-phosphate transaminase (isomerizing)